MLVPARNANSPTSEDHQSGFQPYTIIVLRYSILYYVQCVLALYGIMTYPVQQPESSQAATFGASGVSAGRYDKLQLLLCPAKGKVWLNLCGSP